MEILEKCQQIKETIKTSAKRSESVKLRVTPIILERLKNTSKILHVSRNELVNMVLDNVLI